MKQLVYPELATPIEFSENKVQTVVLESQEFFVRFVQELSKQIHGEEGPFILSEDGKKLDTKKSIGLIIDPFNIDYISKKIQTGIINDLSMNIESTPNNQWLNLKTSIDQFVFELVDGSCIPLKANKEIDLSEIIKLSSLAIDYADLSILESLLLFFQIQQSYLGISLFVLVGFHQYVSAEQLELFYQTCFGHKYSLLILESKYHGILLKEQENIRIVDEDLCEI